MTAKPDLPPSSVTAFTEALKGERGSLDAWLEVNDEHEVAAHIEAYARANVARATAQLQTEIEALRAKVAEWKRVAAAQAELHGEAEARAERLAEAGRRVTAAFRAHGKSDWMDRNSTRDECEAAMLALDAALEQETTNG